MTKDGQRTTDDGRTDVGNQNISGRQGGPVKVVIAKLMTTTKMAIMMVLMTTKMTTTVITIITVGLL